MPAGADHDDNSRDDAAETAFEPKDWQLLVTKGDVGSVPEIEVID